jgi:hypothetical protein
MKQVGENYAKRGFNLFVRLYFSILLRLITIKLVGAVLQVQLLVMFVDSWCAALPLFKTDVISATCFDLIRSSTGTYFYVIAK